MSSSSSHSYTASRASSMRASSEESVDETTQLLPKQVETEPEKSTKIYRLWQVGALFGKSSDCLFSGYILI